MSSEKGIKMNEWITLAETRFSKAQYCYRARLAYPHRLRNVQITGEVTTDKWGMVLLTTAEFAAIPSVKALIEALHFYAQSEQYVLQYHYRGGELLDVDSPITADAGGRARKALAAFEEVK